MINVEMYNNLKRLLCNIQNAQICKLLSTTVYKTKTIIAILNVLYKNQYIRGYRYNIQKPGKIEILLKYKNQEPTVLRYYISPLRRGTHIT